MDIKAVVEWIDNQGFPAEVCPQEDAVVIADTWKFEVRQAELHIMGLENNDKEVENAAGLLVMQYGEAPVVVLPWKTYREMAQATLREQKENA